MTARQSGFHHVPNWFLTRQNVRSKLSVSICLANPEVQRIWGGAKYVGLDQYGEYKGWWEKNGEPLTAEDWTLARAVTEGETSTPEIVNIESFDGQQRTIIMHATPLKDNDNNIIGAIEVNQDVTELKTTERSLKQSLAQWQAIFAQDALAVIQLDEALQIKSLSEKLIKLLINTSANQDQPALDQFLTQQTIKGISDKLKQPAADALTVFELTEVQSEQNRSIYVIHDERQDIAPMTLVFIIENGS